MTSLQRHKRVQHPRGPSALNDAYIGLDGQLTVDSDRQELRLHDGFTPGGHRIANLSQLYALFVSAEGEAGGLDFDIGEFGGVFRVGEKTYAIRQLEVEDGLTIVNANGVDGNPTVGLPGRLDPIAFAVNDANLAEESGFYRLEPTSGNLPDDVIGNFTSTLMSMKHSDGNVTQLLLTIADPPVIYRRVYQAGVWKDWDLLESEPGTYALLAAGEDSIQRTWSAADLNQWLEDQIIDNVANEDADTGTQTTYTARRLFSVSAPDMYDRTPVTRGPYSFAVGDRCIVTAKAQSQQGYSGNVTARVALTLGGDRKVVKEKTSSKVLNTAGDTSRHTSYAVCKVNIVKTADGVDICDAQWGILRSISGTWNGEIEVTVGSATGASTATKYKAKTA